MTARQMRLVRESFAIIGEQPEAIGLLFYGRLFELDPALRDLFKTDMRVQTRKLMSMLDTMVASLDHFDTMRADLQRLGRRHSSEFRVRPEHYELLKNALLWAFGHALEGTFDTELREAWSMVLGDIQAAMLG